MHWKLVDNPAVDVLRNVQDFQELENNNRKWEDSAQNQSKFNSNKTIVLAADVGFVAPCASVVTTVLLREHWIQVWQTGQWLVTIHKQTTQCHFING